MFFSSRSLFHVGLELSGSEGALSALSLICNQLNSVREERREALKTLQHKKQQIDQFTQIAVSPSSLLLSWECWPFVHNIKPATH